MRVLAAIAEQTANDNAAALEIWRADVRAEGDTVEDLIIPAGAHQMDMLEQVWARTSDDVQFFGPVPVPQVRQTPDGHGLRLAGCFAPAGTKDGTGWGWDDTQQGFVGLTLNSANWPYDAVRGVSSIWFEGLPAITDPKLTPKAMMDRWLAINHAYRTGQRSYGTKAGKVDYLAFEDDTLDLRLLADLAGIDLPGDVANLNAATDAEVDKWFQVNAGSVWEVMEHYGGGNPFWPAIYYIGRDSDYASGLVHILGLLTFSSYNWQVATYPLQRYAAAGGVQWVWYDPWAYNSIGAWDARTSIGEVVRRSGHTAGSANLACIIGDGTLRRYPYTENDMDPRVDGLLTRVSDLEHSVGALMAGTPASVVVVTLAHNRQVLHPELFRDDTVAVQNLVGIGKPWNVFPGLSDPFPGIVKELLVQWTRDGVAHSQVFSQFEQVVLA